ncbi:MAG: AAA family ATPase [Coriobacteriales bacterium]|nr:AAA family ATPase [Coriobacteriales bacterium]
MPRIISIGAQRYEYLRTNGYFYIDKTGFIREWWQGGDVVTLICRPRRFGKTLNLDTVRCFLSHEFANRGEELFGGLDVWNHESMRRIQGTIPVISISFANIKQITFQAMMSRINDILLRVYNTHNYLLAWDGLLEGERKFWYQVTNDMPIQTASLCLNALSSMLERYHGVKPVILVDEYDTPMQEAWMGGFWDEAVTFMRDFMNSTFKTNTSLGRGLITGITRVSKESVFSDLNNIDIVSTLSQKYETSFGFTEEEVFNALDEYNLSDKKPLVKEWYDGFTFGDVPDIYNPWSITKFLEYKRFDLYWSNTSSNGLVSSLFQQGDKYLKSDLKTLIEGKTISKVIDEQIIFSELRHKNSAVWPLLLAAGYLKTVDPIPEYYYEPRELAITNHEVALMFNTMITRWFDDSESSYSDFTKSLLAGDVKTASKYLNDVTRACISSFDSGKHPSEISQPERFYHGLVLGLLVELRGRYTIESNRESGYGRYDVALIPLNNTNPALIIEFKVFDPDDEKTLEDTLIKAHEQIAAQAYATNLTERGIPQENIREYGIVFQGKKALIG